MSSAGHFDYNVYAVRQVIYVVMLTKYFGIVPNSGSVLVMKHH